MCNNPTPIEHFRLMQIILNFGENETYILNFLLRPLSVQRSCLPLRGADVYPRYKQIQHLKKQNIVRNIMCFVMNVINARQKILTHLIYLSFSKFSYRQNMFWNSNISPNMPESTSFLLNNRKIRPALRALPQTPYASGDWGIRPQSPWLALSRYGFLAASLNNRGFRVI